MGFALKKGRILGLLEGGPDSEHGDIMTSVSYSLCCMSLVPRAFITHSDQCEPCMRVKEYDYAHT